MEKGYNRLVYFFVAVALITFIGFYKKYFSLAPEFPGLLFIHHLHAVLLTAWLVLLIVQPILIMRKKTSLHRALGKFSYVLAPAAFISMILAYHNQYLRFVSEGQTEEFVLAFVFSPTTDAIPFLILYLLAVFYKKDTPRHMRYMVATGVIVGGPGLGRIFMTWMDMDVFMAIQMVVLFTFLTFIALISYDKFKKKSFRINPYTISFIIWLIPNVFIVFLPTTSLWQNFARWLVSAV